MSELQIWYLLEVKEISVYGPCRSPRHCYDNFYGALKTMGFESMIQDPYVIKCTPITGKPPIYIGMYVDDFVYFLESNQVEEWFE